MIGESGLSYQMLTLKCQVSTSMLSWAYFLVFYIGGFDTMVQPERPG